MTVAASLLVLKLSISGLFRGAAGQDGEKVQKPSCKANEKTNKRLIIEGRGTLNVAEESKKDGSA